jgi:hypothetical protein
MKAHCLDYILENKPTVHNPLYNSRWLNSFVMVKLSLTKFEYISWHLISALLLKEWRGCSEI